MHDTSRRSWKCPCPLAHDGLGSNAGLRVPSEAFAITGAKVDWDKKSPVHLKLENPKVCRIPPPLTKKPRGTLGIR